MKRLAQPELLTRLEQLTERMPEGSDVECATCQDAAIVTGTRFSAWSGGVVVTGRPCTDCPAGIELADAYRAKRERAGRRHRGDHESEDRRVFAVEIHRLEVAFDRRLKAEQLEAYWDALHHDAHQLRAAVDRVIQSSKFFPKIAELVQAMEVPF